MVLVYSISAKPEQVVLTPPKKKFKTRNNQNIAFLEMNLQLSNYWKIAQLLLSMLLLQVQQFRKTDQWELHGSDFFLSIYVFPIKSRVLWCRTAHCFVILWLHSCFSLVLKKWHQKIVVLKNMDSTYWNPDTQHVSGCYSYSFNSFATILFITSKNPMFM